MQSLQKAISSSHYWDGNIEGRVWKLRNLEALRLRSLKWMHCWAGSGASGAQSRCYTGLGLRPKRMTSQPTAADIPQGALILKVLENSQFATARGKDIGEWLTGQKANRNECFSSSLAYHSLSIHPIGTAGTIWQRGNVVCRVPTLASQSRGQKAGVETERKQLKTSKAKFLHMLPNETLGYTFSK